MYLSDLSLKWRSMSWLKKLAMLKNNFILLDYLVSVQHVLTLYFVLFSVSNSSRWATWDSVLGVKCQQFQLPHTCRPWLFPLSSRISNPNEEMASHVYVMEWKDWRMAIMGQERTCWSRILQSCKWINELIPAHVTILSAACDKFFFSFMYRKNHFYYWEGVHNS